MNPFDRVDGKAKCAAIHNGRISTVRPLLNRNNPNCPAAPGVEAFSFRPFTYVNSTTVRLNREQFQLVSGVGHVGFGPIGLQGA